MFAGDLGFRVFKLASSNIRAWDRTATTLTQTLLEASVEHLKTDRTEQDILFELLLKLGLDLCVPIEEKTIAGKAVHSIGGGVADRLPRRRRSPATRSSRLALGIVAGTRSSPRPANRRSSSATAPSPTTWPRPTSPPS